MRIVWELVEDGKDFLPMKQISRTRYYVKEIPNNADMENLMQYVMEDFNDRFRFKIWNILEDTSAKED